MSSHLSWGHGVTVLHQDVPGVLGFALLPMMAIRHLLQSVQHQGRPSSSSLSSPFGQGGLGPAMLDGLCLPLSCGFHGDIKFEGQQCGLSLKPAVLTCNLTA